MSHNALVLHSSSGILTQKCQRSQHWFVQIPHKNSHMPLSHGIVSDMINGIKIYTVKMHILYIFLYSQTHTCTYIKYVPRDVHASQSKQREVREVHQLTALSSFFLRKLAVIQIFHTIPCCSVAKAVVVKF